MNASIARANGRVLGKDTDSVASVLNDFAFVLALRGDELESRLLDDRALDVHVAEIVGRDQDRAS